MRRSVGTRDVHAMRVVFGVCVVLVAVFALYAPAVRLMPFNDDAQQVGELAGVTLASIFENRYSPFSLIFGHYRPMGYVPWLAIRDAFGWYLPSMLHFLNVAFHLVCVACVAGIAWKLCALFRLRSGAIPMLAAAIFGLQPLAFQAVLWAAAGVHVQVAMFGFAATLAYLRLPAGGRGRFWSLLAVAALLTMALLSHEQGPIYGAFLVWAELARARATRTRPRPAALVLFAAAAAYFVFYRAFLHTTWTSEGSLLLEGGWIEYPAKLAYHVQNLVSWPVVVVRPLLTVAEADAAPVVYGVALAVLPVALLLLWRARLLTPALFALGFWLIGILPSMLLSQRYLLDGPRLLYPSTLGSAMFWAFTCAAVWRVIPAGRWRPVLRLGLAALGVGLMVWSADYVRQRTDEAARITPGLRQMGADLRDSRPGDRVLLINAPFAFLTNRPAFLLGREGLPVWMTYYAADTMQPWWPGSLDGVLRETKAVRHELTMSDLETEFRTDDFIFSRGDAFRYGVFGAVVDDGALRNELVRSNLIYKFDYDAPGFRLSRQGKLVPLAPSKQLADLRLGDAHVALSDARATLCSGRIILDLTWWNPAGGLPATGVFVHGHAADGEQVLAADRDPLGGVLPIEQLPAGMAVQERREIRLDAGAAARELRLGLYARSDGRRYQAARPDGSYWPGDEVSVPIEQRAVEPCADGR